jgi:tetratricopeptide (TPR) repeat protein
VLQVWWAKGLWAERLGDVDGAARCYWEAVRLHPNHRRADYRLAQMLSALGRKRESEPFYERAKKLKDLVQHLKEIELRSVAVPTPPDMMIAGEMCKSLGRLFVGREATHLARRDAKMLDKKAKAARIVSIWYSDMISRQ